MRGLVLVALLACSKTESPPPADKPPATSSATDTVTAKKWIADGAAVIDVRSKLEVEDGMLANAKHIPIDELDKRLAEVDTLVGGDKARPIVVYCASGGRSKRAHEALTKAGYTHVVNGGGYDDLR